MADAIITDVVQEVSRILTASDVVVDEIAINIGQFSFRDDIILVMRYHQCKVDSSEGRLEEPEVDGDVKRNWSLSGGDDLKEVRSCGNSTSDVLDKSADMLCHNIGLKRLRFILSALPKPECFRLKNEAFWFWQRTQDESQPSTS